MGLRAKVNGVAASIAAKVGISWVLRLIKGAANGEYGPVWQKRYKLASALAPLTGFLLMVVTVALCQLGMTEEATYVGVAAGFLVSAGLVNGAYLTEIPDVVRYSWVYQKLAALTPVTGFGLGAWWVYLEACSDPACAKQRVTVGVLAAVLIKLGLLDAAWQAKPPRPGVPPPPPAQDRKAA